MTTHKMLSKTSHHHYREPYSLSQRILYSTLRTSNAVHTFWMILAWLLIASHQIEIISSLALITLCTTLYYRGSTPMASVFRLALSECYFLYSPPTGITTAAYCAVLLATARDSFIVFKCLLGASRESWTHPTGFRGVCVNCGRSNVVRPCKSRVHHTTQLNKKTSWIGGPRAPPALLESNATCVQSMTFGWLNPFIRLHHGVPETLAGYISALPQPHHRHGAQALYNKSDDAIKRRRPMKPRSFSFGRNNNNINTVVGQNNGDKYALLRHLGSVCGSQFLWCVPSKVVQDVLQLTAPHIVGQMVIYLSLDAPLDLSGISIVATAAVCLCLQNLFFQHYLVKLYAVGMDVATVCRCVILDKCLRIRTSACVSEGDVATMLQVDVSKVQDTITFLHNVWGHPLIIVLCLVWLETCVGRVATLATLLTVLLLIPINTVVASKLRRNTEDMMKFKDARVRRSDEAFNAIRTVKSNVWEEHVEKSIHLLRENEVKAMRAAAQLEALRSIYTEFAVALVCLSCFVTYVVVGGVLTPKVVVPALTIISIMRFPLWSMPSLISTLVKGWTSLQRINSFLQQDELDVCVFPDTAPRLEGRIDNSSSTDSCFSAAVEDTGDVLLCVHGTFAWNRTSSTSCGLVIGEPSSSVVSTAAASSAIDLFHMSTSMSSSIIEELSAPPSSALMDVHFEARRGEFIAVVGSVGGGKSALLQACVGALVPVGCSDKSYITARGSLVYCNQVPFIRNASIRENITLTKQPLTTAEAMRYRRVIDACALRDDLLQMVDGDNTVVGERGVALSGGQKARVALARACYVGADVYLLDNVLSAVDATVAAHIVDNVLNDLLSHSTRVLVSSDAANLPRGVTRIVKLDHGRIVRCHAMSITNSTLLSFDPAKKELSSPRSYAAAAALDSEEDSDSDDDNDVVHKKATNQQSTTHKASHHKGNHMSHPHRHTNRSGTGITTGGVSSVVYQTYIKSFGLSSASSILALSITAQAVQTASDVWLSGFSSSTQTSPEASAFTLKVYAALGIATAVIAGVRTLTYFVGSVRGANYFHASLLKAFLHAPMSFFERTPIGTVTNALTKDQDLVDVEVPESLNFFLLSSLRLVAALALNIAVCPYLLLLLSSLWFIFIGIMKMYMSVSREVKRMENDSRAPIASTIKEVIQGIVSIRNLQLDALYRRDFYRALDANNRTYHVNMLLSRWVGLRLDFITTVFVVMSCSVAVVFRGVVSAPMAGVAIMYAFNFSRTFLMVARRLAMFENQLTSVERIMDMTAIPSENAALLRRHKTKSLLNINITEGLIQFSGVKLRYAPSLPYVLRGVSFTIQHGEHVGIVGRTGAGKTSLCSVLLRLVDAFEGSVFVSGINTRNLDVHVLRRSVAVLPQDPILLSGTLRDNVDPLKEHSDDAVVSALESAGIDATCLSELGGLSGPVIENGDNFSVGMRQLICLARVVLRDTPVLILDEATSNVDETTSKLVHENVFALATHRTLVVIAHRLRTVVECDRVLVMDDGAVVESGDPQELLQDKSSHLFELFKNQQQMNNNTLKK
eukprot:PhM_4_TR9484/c0_g1_i1/m.82687/K05665/ABCC1; ATP-binding cassette, subfamily C (CFTR/MRP), member 1